MGFVPRNARWWLADCVEVITIEGRQRVLRRTNRRLVNARSAEEAYRRALVLGRESNLVYRNERGQRVRTRFAGLADLNVLHDGVEHGAEIEYFDRTTSSVERARAVVRRKSDLSIFRPLRTPKAAADYMPAKVAAEVRARTSRRSA